MNKIKNIMLISLFLIGCKFTTEPQEIIIKNEGVELNWIRFRNDNAWYLQPYSSQFQDIEYDKFECDEIILYKTDLLFTYEINGNVMIKEISAVYSGDEGWVWNEK